MASVSFQLDEHMDPDVAAGLRRHGIVVVTTDELRMKGATDLQQIAVALEARRVIATFDPDFPALHDLGQEHAGIVHFGKHSRRIGQIIDGLRLVHAVYAAEEMLGRLERF